MRAAQINEYGDASVISVNEVEKPEPARGQLLVSVRAAGLNPFDFKIREGYMKDAIPLKLPVTLGGDIAGEVIETGEDVSGLKLGDKVYGQASAVAGNSGALAEFAAVKQGSMAKMPESTGFAEAASLPLVGVSALQALIKHINLEEGQKIFIHGGAGGIGHIAIQVAKDMGAFVATTATGEGIDFVKELGADEAIDYKSEDFAEKLDGFDAVFDLVGGDDFNKALNVLNSGGTAVSMIAEANEEKLEKLGITAIRQGTKVNTEMLNKLSEYVDRGIVKPQVDARYPLDKTADAFRELESGDVKGKVVIEIA